MKRSTKAKFNTITGAVAGDIIGSVYEWNNIKTTDFDLFSKGCDYTDDTVLTLAVADAVMIDQNYEEKIMEYGRRYIHKGYGGNFKKWLLSDDPQPYGSYGNGSAMRVSAVGFAFQNLDEVTGQATRSTEVTHNHPEGIKGAQAIASAIYLARTGKSKEDISEYISHTYNYDLSFTLNEIRPAYKFDVSCQGSVPQAIVAFLESKDFEHAIRLAISIGGDSDTIACIAGGISAAFYKEIPQRIIDFVEAKLPDELLVILNKFEEKYLQSV